MLLRVAFEYGQTWCASTLCISHSRRVHSGSGTGTKAWNGSPAARARYLGMPENPAAVRSASPSMT